MPPDKCVTDSCVSYLHYFVYACIYMDSFGWGKTRNVVARTAYTEESEADTQQEHFAETSNNPDPIVGSSVPDEKNQLDPPVTMTPFTMPPETEAWARGHIRFFSSAWITIRTASRT
ncbi:hypothetical protein GGR52DRAFT_587025 [Hypoxylon sp. FL1284]|nr:hypothetical protein GGR52DRAFT_587025 [Hypoxylon sp. FL1284]